VRRELYLVDPETGEATQPASLDEALETIGELQERMALKDESAKDKDERIARLRRQRDDARGELARSASRRADAGEVRDILLDWRKVVGWDKATIVPDSDRWNAVSKMRQHFEVYELKAVPHGALKDPWTRAKRHRLDAKELYRTVERVDELRDLGLGVVHRQLPNGLTLPPEVERRLSEIHPGEFDGLDRCDCGRLRFQHPTRHCREFDDIDRRADGWLAKQRQDQRRGRTLSEVADAALRLKGAA
jgi:hypothetical protein